MSIKYDSNYIRRRFSIFGYSLIFLPLIVACNADQQHELDWHDSHGYQWAELPQRDAMKSGFESLDSKNTRINVINSIHDSLIANNRVLLNGSGVAAGDIDGDGMVDLYFATLHGPNRLYKNLGGYRFEDITEKAGVSHEGYQSTGVVFSDVNGNGHLDLLIASINKENTLYLNDGKGNFEIRKDSGLGKAKGSMSMALSDITGNGYPDLYIVNYKEKSIRDMISFTELTSQNMIQNGSLIPPFDEHYILIDKGEGISPDPREIGEKDELFLNNGNGTFTKVENLKEHFLSEDGAKQGLLPDWGLSAKFHDITGDGLQDLYVCNDFWTPDRIWINQGNGTFKALNDTAIRNGSFSSMAVDFSDINQDGLTDIFVVEMLSDDHKMRLRQMNPDYPFPLRIGEFNNRPLYNRNSLYVNQGEETFTEISYLSGLQASNWSWATRFMDVNLDGHEDILVNTGFKYDYQNMDAQSEWINQISRGKDEEKNAILKFPELRQRNKVFKSNGDLTFTEVGSEWGFDIDDISLGMALADLNNDGLLDVAISRMDDEAIIYKNTGGGDRIAVRLIGRPPNTQAIGAKVKLIGGPIYEQSKEIFSGGDYLSGSDPLLVFAAKSKSNSHSLIIEWPDGMQSKINDVKSNRLYKINEDRVVKTEKSSTTNLNENYIFKDITNSFNHIHHEESFNDFNVQPLLPNKLSQLGPGLIWLDLNGDGEDELFVGSGKGGEPGIFQFGGSDDIIPLHINILGEKAKGDHAGVVGWKAHGFTHLITGISNYEQGTIQAPSAYHFKLKNGEIVKVDSIPGVLTTTGPLAAADYSGNGEIDLFIGGRFKPGQYPRDASSRLFQYHEGQWVEDESNSEVFENIGLVTGALFLDYNLNGNQDLILTTEWGSVRLFENVDGKFIEKTGETDLIQHLGWWQGLASGDFTGNGYPDLVVTNMGLNSPYQIDTEVKPLRLFYDDFNWSGRVDIIDSYFENKLDGYVPRRQLQNFESIWTVIPHINTHRQFSESTVEDVLKNSLDDLPYKEVNTLEHLMFFNKEGKDFVKQPLPIEAQFSVGFYLGVADMDNDGNEDIFMAQNFFGVANPQQNPRIDGGRGLWLKGDGDGNFKALLSNVSGVNISGEQRGAALNDINRDGRIDLAVSQSGSDTKLFLNQTEKQGIRIQLVGTVENTSAIGSSLRLIYDDGSKGPLRNIQAGSGYWSQNSVVQVLGFSGSAEKVEVLWFDGSIQTYELEDDKLDYKFIYPG